MKFYDREQEIEFLQNTAEQAKKTQDSQWSREEDASEKHLSSRKHTRIRLSFIFLSPARQRATFVKTFKTRWNKNSVFPCLAEAVSLPTYSNTL